MKKTGILQEDGGNSRTGATAAPCPAAAVTVPGDQLPHPSCRRSRRGPPRRRGLVRIDVGEAAAQCRGHPAAVRTGFSLSRRPPWRRRRDRPAARSRVAARRARGPVLPVGAGCTGPAGIPQGNSAGFTGCQRSRSSRRCARPGRAHRDRTETTRRGYFQPVFNARK